MTASPASSKHDDIAALHHMAHEFTAGFNSGDVDRIMRFYADTYVDINLRHPVQSKAERRQYYLDVMQRRGIRIEVHPDDIVIEEPFAFIRGSIVIIAADQSRSELRYLEIARKAEDGSWKVFWGMDGPVQEYTPST